MTISIIHPSRCRPQMAYNTMQKWIGNLSKRYDVEYILSIDSDDPHKETYERVFENIEEINFILLKNDNISAIQAINNAALVSKNDLFVVVSDDFDCFPSWDYALVENLKDKKDFVVKTSDGIQERLITLPILDRIYYNRFGYIYYPGYQHMFCDTEMTDVGHILERVIDLRCLKFPHNHYIVGFPKDAINEKNDSTWNQGEQLYNSRKQNKFYL